MSLLNLTEGVRFIVTPTGIFQNYTEMNSRVRVQARSVTSRNGGLNFKTQRDTPTTPSQIIRLYCTHTHTLYLTYLPTTVYIRTYLYMGKELPHAYLKTESATLAILDLPRARGGISSVENGRF